MSSSKENNTVSISCSYCPGRTFSHNRTLYVHMRRFHKDKPINFRKKSQIICSLCNEEQKRIKTYWDHIQSKHPEVQLSFEKKCFYSEEDFNKWRKETEARTHTHLAATTAKGILDGGRISQTLQCDRSGPSRPSARFRKSAGTKKIGTSCPVYMHWIKTIVDDLMEIEVNFQSTHVGHKFDVPGLRMHSEQREQRLKSMGKGRWPKKLENPPPKENTENVIHKVHFDEKSQSYTMEVSDILQCEPNVEIQHITCNCHEYADVTICEHVQAIVNNLNRIKSVSEENSSVSKSGSVIVSSFADADLMPVMSENDFASVTQNCHIKTLDNEKSSILDEFQQLINMCETQDHLDILKDFVKEGRKRLSSTPEHKLQENLNSSQNINDTQLQSSYQSWMVLTT